MSRTKLIFVCDSCGYQSAKWLGQCPECGRWGSLRELRMRSGGLGVKTKRSQSVKPLRWEQIKSRGVRRIKTGLSELDRVLGGGIVPGSVVLFAGEPGIGKSTLLTQISLILGASNQSLITVYICGEESPEQIRLRIDRLSAALRGEKESFAIKNLLFLPETEIDLIIDNLGNLSNSSNLPSLLIVDSIQTLFTTDLPGSAGSITQVRECTQRLIELAKTKQIAVFLVGHVTKKGLLAGPKTIEHAVDTVLYFEGERSADFRLLRSVKNRFGPTDEVGVFQMTDRGLKEIHDPTNLINLKIKQGKFPVGSAYTVVFEGTRPIIVEIQALVTKSFTPLPKRVINGLDRRRSEMLIAVLQKYLRIPLWEYDVFLNVAGGFKVFEPAADLAITAAIYSSYKNKPLPAKSVFIGEISLLGEVSEVSRIEKRKKQATALSLKRIFSRSNLFHLAQLKSLFKTS